MPFKIVNSLGFTYFFQFCLSLRVSVYIWLYYKLPFCLWGMTNFGTLPGFYLEFYSPVPDKFAWSVSSAVQSVGCKTCLLEVARSMIFVWLHHRVSYLRVCYLNDVFYLPYKCSYKKYLAQFCHLQFMFSSFPPLWYTYFLFTTCFCFLFNIFKGVYFILNSICSYLLLFKMIPFLNLVITGSWGRL